MLHGLALRASVLANASLAKTSSCGTKAIFLMITDWCMRERCKDSSLQEPLRLTPRAGMSTHLQSH
jgi:hypothetical protein